MSLRMSGTISLRRSARLLKQNSNGNQNENNTVIQTNALQEHIINQLKLEIKELEIQQIIYEENLSDLSIQFQDQERLIGNLQRQILAMIEEKQQRRQYKLLLLGQNNVASVTDYLTITERVQLEKTCKYFSRELQKSKYWRCVVINFSSKLFTKNALYIWKLLCTRKAALASVTITLGNREYDIIKSLLTRCNCSNLQKLEVYISMINPLSVYDYHLLLGAVYPDIVCDIINYSDQSIKSSITVMKTIDNDYEPNSDRPVFFSLVQSCEIKNLRICCTDIEQADMIQYLKTLKNLTIVICGENVTAILQILIHVLKSVERLPLLEFFELRFVELYDVDDRSTVLGITTRSFVVKSNSLKRLKLVLAKKMLIYDIQCPSLEKLEISNRNFLESPLKMSTVNYFLSEYEKDDDVLSRNWKLIEENRRAKCDLLGMYIDELAKDCYINYIKLPSLCKFETDYYYGYIY